MILLVDDDRGVQETLEAILEFEGYQIEVAGDGIEALEKVEKERPDVILLDLMLPRMDGLTFADELERRGLRDSVGIIVVSADSRATQKIKRIEPDGYIPKPFNVGRLIDEVARVLDKKAA